MTLSIRGDREILEEVCLDAMYSVSHITLCNDLNGSFLQYDMYVEFEESIKNS